MAGSGTAGAAWLIWHAIITLSTIIPEPDNPPDDLDQLDRLWSVIREEAGFEEDSFPFEEALIDPPEEPEW